MRISFLQPVQQFDGTRRLLDELKASLSSDDFEDFRLAVAFAKSGPMAKLRAPLEAWKKSGRTSRAIFGIDLFGTTKQALEVALDLFDEVYITHTGGSSTFHPKIYLFRGSEKCRCYYGSHNLTTGGNETNLEAGIAVEFDLPAEMENCGEAFAGWESLLPSNFAGSRVLTAELLENLLAAGLVLDENLARPVTMIKPSRPNGDRTRLLLPVRSQNLFPSIQPKPASPRPISTKKPRTRGTVPDPIPSLTPHAISSATTSSETLVMQIKPHDNGEVFLSRLAVQQNEPFFGFPFTGLTTPKRSNKNKPYPQRDPDPVVNIIIYDASGNETFKKADFALNTVFYEPKSEIRVTISSDIRSHVEPYSIMVMRQSETVGIDYEIEIYNPGSRRYEDLLNVCDQTMPSGGAQARKFGWL